MNNLDCLVRALAHINEAKSLCDNLSGNRDYLESTKEPFEDIKDFVADSIILNAKLSPSERNSVQQTITAS